MYKTMPIGFFENLKTQKKARIDDDEVVPFKFSKKVLKGESEVKATLPKKKNV